MSDRYDYVKVDYILQSGTTNFASYGEIACLNCFAFASKLIRESAGDEVLYNLEGGRIDTGFSSMSDLSRCSPSFMLRE
jgi:hypothetical protein